MFVDFKDRHAGQACYVIGNGPSLRQEKNAVLETLPSFGTNRVYLKLTPRYYVCMNALVLQQNKAEIDALECTKFVRAGAGINGFQLHKGLQAPWSYNPNVWVNEGYTVTYVCLQLAFWMGFKTVYLVGVDHRYTFDGRPNETKRMDGDDPNHFDPNYFKGQNWQNPDLANSEKYYRVAKGVFEGAGRKIINLTPGSGLDVFPKGAA